MLTPSDAAKQKGITSSSSTINNKVIISALESSINTIFHFFLSLYFNFLASNSQIMCLSPVKGDLFARTEFM